MYMFVIYSKRFAEPYISVLRETLDGEILANLAIIDRFTIQILSIH